jgi:hypothetical protein
MSMYPSIRWRYELCFVHSCEADDCMLTCKTIQGLAQCRHLQSVLDAEPTEKWGEHGPS